MTLRFLVQFSFMFFMTLSFSQTKVSGTISFKDQPLAYATIRIVNSSSGVMSDKNGFYELEISQLGEYKIQALYQGYRSLIKTITVSSKAPIVLNFELTEDALGLDEIVVSATRNRVERKNSPVVVSTLKPQILTATQSVSLADGLNYAPGVRVETNCQNCGFTQVRLNGLDGAYTQVLLNSRPVFSSLIGVYGLEQIPTNIIERVEVVRSGGSALYGSNAIAGTVNIITKDPVLNTWDVGSVLSLIGGDAVDKIFTVNTSIVADDLKSGFTVYGNYRNRDAFDANDDGFTEIVELRNTTFGGKAFFKPNDQSRLSINASAIREYRRGGDRLDLAPQFTDITEELDHDTFIGGVEYERSSNDNTSNLQLFSSASYTNRDSYYGGLGGGRTAQDSALASNAFGITKDLAWVSGIQQTKNFKRDVLTTGLEYNLNSTEDVITGYNKLIDQQVNLLGLYGQYEWKPTERFVALLGARIDYANVSGLYTIADINREVDFEDAVLSPRLTLMYQLNETLKLRGGYARGFRAPQAFNEDIHISSVGGEPQFVILSNDLQAEFSNAFTASLNFAQTKELRQLDVLLEGFFTTLENPFTTVSTGATLDNGSIIQEVRNGNGARVYGANFELGVSPNPQWQMQIGGTIQRAEFNESQILFESDGTAGETDIVIDEFIRTPNVYGYLNTAWIPNKKFNLDLTGTYTGSMTVPLVISDTGFLQLNEVNPFFDLNIKVETHFDLTEDFMVTLSGGIKNLFNSYQDDFDIGAMRDSDYIYGPAAPRTIFIGLKFGKLH
jgi:outer membrane receptor for ferrienterochelin and colicins